MHIERVWIYNLKRGLERFCRSLGEQHLNQRSTHKGTDLKSHKATHLTSLPGDLPWGNGFNEDVCNFDAWSQCFNPFQFCTLHQEYIRFLMLKYFPNLSQDFSSSLVYNRATVVYSSQANSIQSAFQRKSTWQTAASLNWFPNLLRLRSFSNPPRASI